MSDDERKATAVRIMERILGDATDRGGWCDDWDQFTPDIQEEIRQTWTQIILDELKLAP